MTSALLPFPSWSAPSMAAVHSSRQALAGAFFAMASLAATAQTAAFDIPAQPLPDALRQFAAQSGVQLAYPPALVAGRQARAVRGTLDARAALDALLGGSGLQSVQSGATLGLVPAVGASSPHLKEVTVTARSAESSATAPVQGYVARRSATALKRDAPLLETPQSITVVGAEEMAARKTDSVAEALLYAPGILTQPSGFSRLADDYNIRGFDAGGRTGSVLRDGLKLQSAQFDGGQEPYGLERVELLRGASSVLYGQLSPGGLINTVSKQPGADPLHEVLVEGGSHDRRQIATDHAGALDAEGRLTYRLTAMVRRSGTQVDGVPDDKIYMAPALRWQPDAATSVTLLASHQRTDTRFGAPMPYNSTLWSSRAGTKIPYTLFVGEPGFDRYVGTMDTVGWLVEHRFNDQLQLRHALRGYRSQARYSYITPGAVAGTRLARRADLRGDDSTAITSDTQLQWDAPQAGDWQNSVLAGLDLYRRGYDTTRYTGTAAALDLARPVYGQLPVIGAVDGGSDQTGLQAGLYLQSQMRWRDQWVVVLGGRYDRAHSETVTHRTGATALQRDSEVTGRAGVVRLLEGGWAPYASVSQSFFPTAGVNRQGQAFQPTRGEQVELGVRWQPAGSDTLVAAALYQLAQDNVLTEDPVDPAFSVQTGRVRARGLELEARFSPVRHWSVVGAYQWVDARTVQDSDPALVGRRSVGVPRQTASLWADYHLAGWGLPGLRVGMGARWRGTAPTAAGASDAETPAYALVDLRVAYATGHWLTSVKVSNVAGRESVHCQGTCRYGDLRSVAASVGYRW